MYNCIYKVAIIRCNFTLHVARRCAATAHIGVLKEHPYHTACLHASLYCGTIAEKYASTEIGIVWWTLDQYNKKTHLTKRSYNSTQGF